MNSMIPFSILFWSMLFLRSQNEVTFSPRRARLLLRCVAVKGLNFPNEAIVRKTVNLVKSTVSTVPEKAFLMMEGSFFS